MEKIEQKENKIKRMIERGSLYQLILGNPKLTKKFKEEMEVNTETSPTEYRNKLNEFILKHYPGTTILEEDENIIKVETVGTCKEILNNLEKMLE